MSVPFFLSLSLSGLMPYMLCIDNDAHMWMDNQNIWKGKIFDSFFQHSTLWYSAVLIVLSEIRNVIISELFLVIAILLQTVFLWCNFAIQNFNEMCLTCLFMTHIFLKYRKYDLCYFIVRFCSENSFPLFFWLNQAINKNGWIWKLRPR